MAKSKNSSRSRAARREVSPDVDVDKSVTSLPRVDSDPVQRPSILIDRANAGVSKKQAKSKPKSRAQKLRQQKGMDRAEVVVDQLEKKVTDSVKKGKNVKSRKADWEDTNRKTNSTFAALQVNVPGGEGEGADDNNTNNGDDAMVDDDAAPVESNQNEPMTSNSNTQQNHFISEPTVNQHADVEEDEIT